MCVYIEMLIYFYLIESLKPYHERVYKIPHSVKKENSRLQWVVFIVSLHKFQQELSIIDQKLILTLQFFETIKINKVVYNQL